MYPVSVYKKFTPEDFSYIPFNANKQYIFNSSSAAENNIKVHSARWTSESISLYSSASTVNIWSGQSSSFDPINTIKYSQIDHLYYRDFKNDLNNRFGDYHYLKTKRTLYDKVNILSVPAGLYGHQIKKGEFILSSSNFNFSQSQGTNDTLRYGIEIKDDGFGNLYDSSIDRGNFITDIRRNLFNVGPVKGFKRYDLGTYDGYVKIDGYKKQSFWRRGKENPNAPFSYTSFDHLDEFDDSYYFNHIKYKNVRYSEQPLFIRRFTGSLNEGGYPDITLGDHVVIEGDYFPCINMGRSEIRMGHDEKFNFNPTDNFSISFWFKNAEIGNGWVVEESAIYEDEDGQRQYVISKSTTKQIISPKKASPKNDILPPLSETDSSQPKDVFAENSFPFEVYIKDSTTIGKHIYFSRSNSSGQITTISGSLEFTNNNPFMQHITCMASESVLNIYVNGVLTGSIEDNIPPHTHTENTADLFVGNQGGFKNYYNGVLSQLNIFDKALNPNEVIAHYSSSNNSPYVGNIFYSHGIATVTHPKYFGFLSEYVSNPSIPNQQSANISTQLVFKRETPPLDTLEVGYTEQLIRDVSFKPDGTRMYILGHTDTSIKSYELTTPWDVSTAQPLNACLVNFTNTVQDETGTVYQHATENEVQSFDFHRDGTSLVILGMKNRRIYELNFDEPWNINTVSNVSRSVSMSNFSDNGGPDPLTGNLSGIGGTKYLNSHPNCVRFENNGGKLFVMFGNDDLDQTLDPKFYNRIAEIKLGEQFDISTLPFFPDGGDICIESKTFDLETISGNGYCNSFDFNKAGSQFIFNFKEDLAGSNGSRVYQVYLSSSFNIDSTIYSGYYKDLPISSEQSITKHEGVRWEETNPALGKDPRVYVCGDLNSDSRFNNRIIEYHFKKGAVENLEFKGNHLIFEHEYRCSVPQEEFNDTLNPTVRKIQKTTNEDLEDFATGSLFKPYVTTIGLYNEDNELLVVGKLGQPIRMSDETDSHFIVRWDT